jgi:acyl-CoA reductase-like NAD-dependent aldehyde dehydrogenase
MGPLIEAILAGNGIIIKGSEQTAWSAQYNIAVAKAALTACGYDSDLVQVYHCLATPNPSEHNVFSGRCRTPHLTS